MENKIIIAISLAGVITAIAAVILSLIMCLSYKKKIKELEFINYSFNRKRYNELTECYNEVVTLEPIYENIEIEYNLPFIDDKDINVMFKDTFLLSIERHKWLEDHYRKISFSPGGTDKTSIEDTLRSLGQEKSEIHFKLIQALENHPNSPVPIEEMRAYITDVQKLEDLYIDSIQKEIDLIAFVCVGME